jgi:K+-sensing histidine kinase KdpD
METHNSAAYERHLFRVMLLFPILLIPLVIVTDPPFIIPDLRHTYVLGRLIFGVWFLGLYGLTFYSQKHWHLVSFYIGIVCYSVFGQFFLPSYYMVFMEAVVPMALFLPFTEVAFYSVTILGAICMILAVNMMGTSYSTDPTMLVRFRFDASMATGITSGLSIVGYHFVARVRKEKDILSAKFLDIGQNTSSILHDFKGLLSTPLMYIQMLAQKAESMEPNTAKLIANLNEDFAQLCTYVGETNHLNRLKDHTDVFRLSEVIDSLRVIMKSSLRGVSVEVLHDPKFELSKNLLLKVLYNIFTNCVESMRVELETNVNKQDKIQVSFDSLTNSIFVDDSGTGLTPDALKRLNSKTYVSSTKVGGSGIGSLMIRELIGSAGGTVKFHNRAQGGSRVQILLPKRTFLSE